MSRFKIWFLQVRGPFLILSVILVFLGTALASRDASPHLLHVALLVIGVVQTHMAVNLFNELSDHETGIDTQTQRTPFSGGSGMLQAGFTTPDQVRRAAYLNMISAGMIGAGFVLIHGWPLLVIMALGAIAIRFYTTHLARWQLGEMAAGLTLGTGVVLGVCYALTGNLTPEGIYLSVPPGLLTTQLLFLNEFPDADADKIGGRRHWVIVLGRRRSAFLYILLLGMMYVWIGLAPLLFQIPKLVWIGLGTLPVAFFASKIVLTAHEDMDQLLRAMGMNVMIVLLTDLLLGLGIILA